MKLLKVVVLLAVAYAQPALADWQGARWGSSFDQLSKATAQWSRLETPHDADPQNGHQYAIGTYRAGQFQFSAAYEFTENQFSGVRLTLLENGDCSALFSSLLTKYGKPIREDMHVPNERVWQDKAHSNHIVLKTYTDHFCTVDYSPLETATTHGL